MQEIHKLLEQSLEDYSVSRSERKEIKAALVSISTQPTEQAKTRKLAFRLATNVIEEIGEIAAMEWLESIIKLIYAGENKIKSSAYFSPGNDCLNRIRRLISEAQQSLDICVFTITDNRIVERIIESHDRGVKVRIISDNDKSHDLGSDMDRLEKAGIPCLFDATDAHMHHKYAIADGNTLLNGSFNWTRSASSPNNENILVTNDPKLLGLYKESFEKLWASLA